MMLLSTWKFVEKGQGYVPGDKNKKQDQPIGLIPVDSIYSPITRVKFGVTDTRVGNVTNYDKLTLEVWTDGSIMPDEAVNAASGIMIGYCACSRSVKAHKRL